MMLRSLVVAGIANIKDLNSPINQRAYCDCCFLLKARDESGRNVSAFTIQPSPNGDPIIWVDKHANSTNFRNFVTKNSIIRIISIVGHVNNIPNIRNFSLEIQ